MPMFRLGALRDLFSRTETAKEAEPQSLNLVQRPRLEPAKEPLRKPTAAEPVEDRPSRPQHGARERPVARAVRKPAEPSDSYTAADIEVLEGLEPVRRRPGMYVGGTDEKALHHLFAEVID